MRTILTFGIAAALCAPAALRAQEPEQLAQELLHQAQEKAQEKMQAAQQKLAYAQDRAQERAVERAVERVQDIKVRTNFNWNGKGGDEGTYRSGARQLEERQYEKAVESYNRVIDGKGSHIEGALYWKAYALSRLGRGDQATASLEELKKGYPQSRWLNDARALELEIRQNAGQKPSPESESDEDLKLLAMSGLIGTDPERVMPQIDKILNSAKSSPKLKERALFVLAQSRNAKAREILLKYAKGGINPDLQLKAVEYLAAHGVKEDRSKLDEIYQANPDVGIRRAILRGYMASHEIDALMQVARNDQNPVLRAEAIRYAGINGADIWPLYSASGPVEVRQAVLEALFVKADAAHLIELARAEKEVKIRRDAVRHLGNLSREKTGDALVTLYTSEQDKEVRQDILRSLANQNNAKSLIEVARKESDPQLKRDAVRELTRMKSPEAQEFLVELLNK